KGPAGSLVTGQRCPPLVHEVEERRVERVAVENSATKPISLGVSRAAIRFGLGKHAPVLAVEVRIACGNFLAGLFRAQIGEEPPLDNPQHLVATHGLALCIDASYEVVERD